MENKGTTLSIIIAILAIVAAIYHTEIRRYFNLDYERTIEDADALYSSGEYEKAKEYYINALRYDPDNFYCKERINDCKRKLEYGKEVALADQEFIKEKYKESIYHYERALLIIPNDKYCLNRKMLCEQAIKKKEASANVVIPKQEQQNKSTSSTSSQLINNACYQVRISSGYIALRTRPLSAKEIRIANACATYSDGEERSYEDLNKSSCIEEKKIDNLTYIGSVARGDKVKYLGKQGSFYKISHLKKGRVGFISARLGGVSTLVQSSCN